MKHKAGWTAVVSGVLMLVCGALTVGGYAASRESIFVAQTAAPVLGPAIIILVVSVPTFSVSGLLWLVATLTGDE